jgi:hypothetical protein
MKPEDKKTLIWTGGIMAALAAALAVLWATGVLQAVAVE